VQRAIVRFLDLLEHARRGWLEGRPQQVVVRCAGGGHRVRLAKGRFWSAAHCRACGARVDARRLRRVGRWLVNLCAPTSAARLPRGLWVSVAGYSLLTLVSAACLWLLADRWWPATTLLFGPRWLLLVPLGLLVPGALRWDRPLMVPLALAGLVALGPVMGFRTGWHRLFVAADPAHDLRVMSFNAMDGSTLTLPPAMMLAAWNVDIAAFQECDERLSLSIQTLKGWHTDTRAGLCFVSRFPILDVAEMERESLQGAGGSGLVVTYRLDLDGRQVRVTNVHLETPRAGLESLREGRLGEGIFWLREKSSLREIELRRARRWVNQFTGPQLVMGDFNTPPESPIFRAAWSDWTNAFSLGGRGFGGSRHNGWIRARIDHILLGDDWTVVRSWLGPDIGSDHVPMLAEIRLRSSD
jgi:endonuclease/exonuclease/phosphatase (EEP) superfamily protein YafD